MRRAVVSLFEGSSAQLRSNEDPEGPEYSNNLLLELLT